MIIYARYYYSIIPLVISTTITKLIFKLNFLIIKIHTKMKKYFLLGVLLISSIGYSQIGISTSTPDATLDIRAKNHNGTVTAKDGVLVPRVNSLAVNGSVNGQLVYLITDAGSFTQGFYYWNGSAWTGFSGTGTPVGSGDTTNDAFTNNSANTRVELGSKSDGVTARTAGTEFVIKDNGSVGIGTSAPVASAILDISTVNNKGVLLPKVALTGTKDATTIASPATGLLVYNTAIAGTAPNDVSPGYYYWDGAKWAKLAASTSGTSSWAVGEERAFMYSAPATTFYTDNSTTQKYMYGKDVTNVGDTYNRLLSQAMTISGGDASGGLIINGLRLDFLSYGTSPRFVNTTAVPKIYSSVGWSTNDNFVSGTKTTIAGNAICWAVDGNNDLTVSQNDVSEAVHGMIVFSTGEWYSYMFYPINIDGTIQGYTTARRIR